MKLKVGFKTPDRRQVELVAEPEALAYITIEDVPAEELEVISIEIIK